MAKGKTADSYQSTERDEEIAEIKEQLRQHAQAINLLLKSQGNANLLPEGEST